MAAEEKTCTKSIGLFFIKAICSDELTSPPRGSLLFAMDDGLTNAISANNEPIIMDARIITLCFLFLNLSLGIINAKSTNGI